MEENKEMVELLKRIEKENRRQARMGMLQCVLTLLCVVCCAGGLVLVLQILPQASSVITQVQTVLDNLEQTTAQLAAVDFESMVADVDALVTTGQQSLEQTMHKLNSIDIDTLNQAIEDLAAVVEPLAKFFNVFRS